MGVYKKALLFLLSFTLFLLTACGGEYKYTGNDNKPSESSVPSSIKNDTDIEQNSNIEISNQFSGTWPDNEFTRQVPNPGFEVHSVTTNSNSCNITFRNTTIEQLKEYVETVKDMGFTTILTRETEISGMKHYLYTARSANEYEIIVTKSVSYSILTINKLD